MKKILGFLMALIVCLGIGFLIAPQDVYAAKQEGDIAGGVYDGVDWRVTADGELILGNGGTQTMTYRESRNWGSWPWGILRIGSSTVKRISIDGKVVLQGSIRSMFTEHGELTYANLTGLDTANVSEAESIFFRCFKLKEVDFTGCTFENTPNIGYLFYEDRGLEKVNFCDLNNSANTNYNIFYGCTNLKSITFGPNVSFVGKGNPGIPTPTGSQYSGKWIREDRKYGPYTPNELKDNYTSDMAGTWIWEVAPCAVFSEDGTLSFIRPTSDSTYTSGSTGTVTSISGGEYTGKIYVVDEIATSGNRTWSSVASQVKKVQFIDEIKPCSTDMWFYNFKNCTEMDLKKLDTSNCVMFGGMFGNCGFDSIDVSHFDTKKAEQIQNMFYYCTNLTELDLSNFDFSQVCYNYGFVEGCKNLSTITLPDTFKFVLSTSSTLLPKPSTTSPYTGKWIRADNAYGPFSIVELRDNYTPAMAGKWVWEQRDPNGYIVFDGNGGVISGNTKITFTESEGVHPFNTLDEDVCQHGTKFLMGWSEDQAATEPTYQPGEEINIGELEKTKTLYAIWTADGVTRYHVKHYQQAYDLSGYTLTETERLYGQAGAEVTPDVKTYDGFAQPSIKTVTLAADGSTEVEYKYDRLQYRIHFDGNTATAGSMSDMRMLMGVGSQLRSNAFRKTGAIFTGWNTAADGSGTTYTDKANVVDLTNEHGSTVTLYAQWLENTNPAVTPTNGAVRVTLKQGQTVVIPDLPAGTSYTIREVSNPAGWEWKSTDGETGTITANQTNDATVYNVYHAVGSIPFEIYKVLEDGLSGENKPIEAGKFTFALVDAFDMRIMVASNEATDTDETIFNEAGEEVPNPNYGKALVSFDTIEYDESDIGKTYTYYISEINTPEGYEASEPVKVTVSIVDAGKGQLDITASYDHNQEIKNTDKTGGFLEIKKLVSGSAPEGAEFTFKVDLSDADGRTYAESVSGVKSDESTLNITSGESITLKADESATFRLPAGVTYKVSEETADGWTLVQFSGESGEIVSGETAHAVFTNAYDVDGIVSIPATKNLVGKELTAGEFEFVLEDVDGNIVSQATNDADGNITFNIPYTTEDVGKSYTYTAHEVIPDETFGITYDKTVFTVNVDVTADNGKLTGSVNIADHDSMVFNNTYAASTDITVSGKKVMTGRDFRDSDKWTFTLDGEGPKPAETSVEIYPAQGDEFSFTIPFNVSDMDGQRTKDFEYTVTESGFVPLVANDTSVKSFTVRVTDEGTGVMKAEIVDADNLDLTFTNRALVTLPMTGSMTSIWIMLAGLLVIATGYAYSRKRKGGLSE